MSFSTDQVDSLVKGLFTALHLFNFLLSRLTQSRHWTVHTKTILSVGLYLLRTQRLVRATCHCHVPAFVSFSTEQTDIVYSRDYSYKLSCLPIYVT